MLKRFLITSKNFDGQVETVYNDAWLQLINFAESSMNAGQRSSFKTCIPVLECDLSEFSQKYSIVIVEAEYEVSFNDFWKGYDKKINRLRSEKLWAKMTKTEQVLCVTSLPAYHAYRRRLNKYQYDADTYLRERMWENEWKKLSA